MTSASRLGHRTSGHQEETIRLGLTEAQAETLGLLLRFVEGPNGKSGGPASRRVHVDGILDALRGVGVMTWADLRFVDAGPHFASEEGYDHPLNAESQEVTYL